MPLLSCSSAALLWPFAKCGVKLGEKRDTLVWSLPVVVQLQQVLRVHGLSLPPWAQRAWSLSPASMENRSLPHAWYFGNPVSSFSTCRGETEVERCSRETGGNGNKKMLERNWKENT